MSVTERQSEAAVRRWSALGNRRVVCLDVRYDFDPADKARVDRMRERLANRIEL